MREWFVQYVSQFSGRYLLLQTLVILALFLMGFVILVALTSRAIGDKPDVYNPSVEWNNYERYVVILTIRSFPVGLSVFVIESYLMLVLGIKYTTWSVLAVYVITLSAFIIIGIKTGRMKAIINAPNAVMLSLILMSVILIAHLACSGIVPISISNDSMYYFHEYPRDIVYFGRLRDQFDTFLTDTGLGSVVIDTLPFLFGFNESFGIRTFMHFSFFVYFILACLRIFESVFPKETEILGRKVKAKALLMAFLSGLVMVTSSPVYILGHWAMANMYFMEFFFIGAFEMYVFNGKVERYMESTGLDKPDSKCIPNLIPAALICIACSLIRMEGGIFMVFLLLTFTMLEVSDMQVSLLITLPIMLLTGGYALKIYLCYTIDNPYTFLSPVKSLLQVLCFICIIVYSIFIKKRLPEFIRKHMPLLIMLGLAAVNVLLLFYNRSLYIANLKAFYRNLTGQSGWGMLPNLAAASIAVLIVLEIADRIKGIKSPVNEAEMYFSVLTVGFVLVTVAVSFARGDELMQQVGDSGNRVLLQVAPLLIFTIILYFVRAYERTREN